MEVTTPAPVRARGHGALPRSTGPRASPTATWAARAGCTTTTSSSQWFPKIGVFWKGAWNAHQFHPSTRVLLRLRRLRRAADRCPQGFVVGATGRAAGDDATNADGTETLPLPPGGRPRLRLDGQPPLPGADAAASTTRATRRWTSACSCSPSTSTSPSATSRPPGSRCAATAPGRRPIPTRRSRWSIPPGAPPRAAWSTRRSSRAAPASAPRRSLQSPESVTIHECGHQFWYGLVGNNEFEEAWLDEGFNSYHDEKAAQLALGPAGLGPALLRPARPGRGSRGGLAGGGARRLDRPRRERPRRPAARRARPT